MIIALVRNFILIIVKKKGLALPEFSADKSQGKIVSNQKAKSIYQFKHHKL